LYIMGPLLMMKCMEKDKFNLQMEVRHIYSREPSVMEEKKEKVN
jgi:hypothetical protein